ncbi:MAG TPA: EAL domain-containing protein [Mariprofundaceae bacterium]|nr:EAL domain-containing protein [Mariprofundaceae bacterium]
MREIFRISAILVLLVPYGVLGYMMFDNGDLSVIFQQRNILIFGFGIIIVLAVLAILQGVFNKLSALAETMTKAAGDDATFHEFSNETRELQEISRAFRKLLERYDETSQELSRLTQLFLAMKELGDAATRKLELPALLNLLLDRAMQATRAQIGSVFLIDPAKYSFRIMGARGIEVEAAEIAIEDSVVASVVSDKKPLLVTDIENDPNVGRSNDPKYGPPSFLAMPVMFDGVLLGVLNLAHKSNGAIFHEGDVELLTTMINQVHIALENAYVHETVKKHMHSLDEKTNQLNEEIDRRKQMEEELQVLAMRDKLTGLANRHQFLGLLEQAIAQCRRNKQRLAVLFIDMDRFKMINDSMGHDIGDLVLQEAARRMRDSLREMDTIARYGGDEFTCMLMDVHGEDDVVQVAGKLIEVLSRPFSLLGREYFIGSSVGISLYPDNGERPEDLVKNADAAMYKAKEKGGRGYSFYTPAIGEEVSQRVQMEIELRQAVNRGEFTLHYQPQVDLRDGHLSGIEALLRWQHPEYGLLNPDDFIPVAEQAGLIVPIGRWVLGEACRQFKKWRDQGLVPAGTSLNAAVNISSHQFRQGDFIHVLGEVLEQTGIDPQMLELEITESIIMDAGEHAVDVLRSLKEMGVRLAIDDFGNGFSSLGYLKHFPIDTIKIDKVFIRHLPGDRDDAAIVRAILELAHSLDLKVVAEWVENVEQLHFLRKNGCHYAQGYLLGRPVEAKELLHMIRDEHIQKTWRELTGDGVVASGGDDAA